jgi:hypothetical protein
MVEILCGEFSAMSPKLSKENNIAVIYQEFNMRYEYKLKE